MQTPAPDRPAAAPPAAAPVSAAPAASAASVAPATPGARAAAPAAAAPAPAKSRLPPAVWFLLGALTASAGWYGYGLLQRALVRSIASGMSEQANPAQGSDAQMDQLAQQAQQLLQAAAASGAQAPQGSSSLDLVSGPKGAPGAAQGSAPGVGPGPGGVGGAPNQQAMMQAGANMLGSLMPLLNSPAARKGMAPEQRKALQEMLDLMTQLQASTRSGRPMSRADQAELSARLQKLSMQAFPQMQGIAPPAAAPTQAPPQAQQPAPDAGSAPAAPAAPQDGQPASRP
jgi:hypothetical protein